MAHTLTTCMFCGVGCGVYLETSGNRVVGAYPSVSHPANQGRICLRGWHVHEIADSQDRLKAPLIKKNGTFQEVTWDEAFDVVAQRLSEIRKKHGPDAIAFLNSPRCSNEESYLLQKLARAVVGTNNVHHGTGVYANNSINVLSEMIGVPASTNSISELSKSEAIIVDGVDLVRRMPTLAGNVIRAKVNGAKLIVVGTRRHRVAENADVFVQIKPNTEAMLYGAMAKVIVDRGMMNLGFIRERCSGYEEFLDKLQYYDLLSAAEMCGVAPALIERAALTFASAQSASLLYSTSMEERTKDSIRAVVNLALLTGNIGKPGSGIFALTEQNNLQGVCDMGMIPDRLPGYCSVTDETERMRFEKIWLAKLPKEPGLGARTILNGNDPKKVKALWLDRYDPISTAFRDVASALQHFDFVVVQHIFMTDSAQYADVVLPTTAFGEEQVSTTSTERRIQLSERVVDPPAGLTPGWQQIRDLAERMGARWAYDSAADVMNEICESVSIYSGASYENLTREYGRQWPCTKDRPLGTRYLFAENGDGKRFCFAAVNKPAAASTAKDFPFTLVFGHSLYYWNLNVLVRHSEALRREYRALWLDYPEGFVEINDRDAEQLGIRDGQRIRITAPTGSAATTARVTEEVMAGTVFIPYFMHHVQRHICAAGSSSNLVAGRIEKDKEAV
ncbi:MAG TPA: molybdopterin-dependent oxidoreductase [Terriglobales bacterium]|nr:molybdopterin-dependent oxidoreductase [Terriglobales bacterium]